MVALLHHAVRGAGAKALRELKRPVAAAATAAMAEAVGTIKVQVRADIDRAGFSTKWQNAFRVEVYPGGGRISIGAAALAHHRIDYATIFEEGGTIRGKPLLWVPLENTPKRVARRRMTPESFSANIGPLTYIDRRGRPPLLAARAALGRAGARKTRPKVSMAALRRGAAGGGSGRTVLRSVPLFVGLDAVRIGKKFDILGIVERAADRLGSLYLKHFRG